MANRVAQPHDEFLGIPPGMVSSKNLSTRLRETDRATRSFISHFCSPLPKKGAYMPSRVNISVYFNKLANNF